MHCGCVRRFYTRPSFRRKRESRILRFGTLQREVPDPRLGTGLRELVRLSPQRGSLRLHPCRG